MSRVCTLCVLMYWCVGLLPVGGVVTDSRHGHHHIHQNDHSGHPEPVQLRGGGEPGCSQSSPGPLQGGGRTQRRTYTSMSDVSLFRGSVQKSIWVLVIFNQPHPSYFESGHHDFIIHCIYIYIFISTIHLTEFIFVVSKTVNISLNNKRSWQDSFFHFFMLYAAPVWDLQLFLGCFVQCSQYWYLFFSVDCSCVFVCLLTEWSDSSHAGGRAGQPGDRPGARQERS